ncbi:MAG TPA: UDP-N-acetylmuramoylalanyl-D-glutamyl-2, 6-diaminopimelate--D-alanyl-D-alanine ligase [Clostridiales bacterium]|nr:UDP-N-acetylmuramoylalanyl-D-glutamyl-2, 6-diaminopimelate--D-alanyl-D-alanine ligase [Clostridiales bacterium]
MKELTVKQIVQAAGGKYHGPREALKRAVPGIVIDSRAVKPGFLYVPIKGERFDGHGFIPAAYENGALCCISERPLHAGKPYIHVPDSLRAFQDIAAYYKSLLPVKTIGITGSAGKTTTKEMIAAVLSQRFSVLKTEGNFNNQTGVPLTLLRLTERHEIAVVEMGTNHFGEIRALSKIARPNDCFLTNIGTAHIEHLGSKEGILKAKCEMLEYMDQNGRVFYNGDDEYLRVLKDCGRKTVSYGLSAGNDFYAKEIRPKGLLGTDFTICHAGCECTVHISAPGEYMVQNALAAFAAGVCYGMTEEEIKAGLASFAPVGDRMRTIEANGVTVLSDVYNANPDSVRAALAVLALARGRKVCVLGDMLELGRQAETLHFETGLAAAQCADIVLCVGALARHIAAGAGAKAQWFETQQELITALPGMTQSGDTVLVKGSRGMKLEETVAALTGR